MPRQTRPYESGQGLVEVALIIVLVGVAAMAALAATGTSLQDLYCDVVNGIGGTEGEACSGALFSDNGSLMNCGVRRKTV